MSETNPKHYVGNKSELKQNSEINPKKLGNKSENRSEINPTYHTTSVNHTTKDNNYKKSKTLETKEKQSSCSSDNKNLEKWILEKSKKARNPSAYAASIKRKFLKEEQSILDEFENWKKLKEEFKQKEAEGEKKNKIEHTDYSIFIENPQILGKFIGAEKNIKYVVDTGLSTLDITFHDSQTTHIFKKDLYPILKNLEQEK